MGTWGSTAGSSYVTVCNAVFSAADVAAGTSHPAVSLVHVFYYHRDSCFNNLLIFSIPCVFILSLQQHIF